MPAHHADVEAELRSLFPSGDPVVFSSGRAALAMVVAHLQLNRSDTVDIFPYASHCVIDAVGRRAMPEVHAANASLRLVHHQFGFVQEHGLTGPTIEDAVDTLCVPGTPLFPSGGDFELWSLPKILGTLGGSVLWCRDPCDAAALRVLRATAGGRLSQWLLRVLGTRSSTAHLWWQGAEPAFGESINWQLGELRSALRQWNDLAESRAQSLEAVRSAMPPWLSLTAGRLPSAVPVQTENGSEIASRHGLSAGMRHFERVKHGSRDLVRVLPIPIHQDMPIHRLLLIAEDLVRGDTT